MSDKSQLLSMGFEETRIDWALKATQNSGLQPAMDHILANMDNAVPAPEEADEEDEEEAKAIEAGQDAKSIKCTECDKIFKNTALANFHAEKSGHTSFEESTEEIKPLTEEEKKARLEELREKMAAKRAVKAKQEAIDNKANEALRRKAGKESLDIKENLQLKQANKEALERKREKDADAKARAAIKAQIEEDKKARAERTAREKALREGKVPAQQAGGVDVSRGAPAAATVAAGKPAAGRDYPETRLQARLSTGGPPLTKTLPSTAKLTEVSEWLASESLSFNVGSILLSTRFPNRTFGPGDFEKTLKELDLTPSAILFASPM
ncbi:Predicted ubiquitin regulatory protein [Phaffia rhodozyma]|uniref:Predicted ubiquitin regulatory protein n=1 Tax=Phaffia rhodozyma TaxID=264483 RepID=A0A0F7SGB3_PHARH|nr:Predicted ubiquitin regulatory protein [Phaffia rhodozyma]